MTNAPKQKKRADFLLALLLVFSLFAVIYFGSVSILKTLYPMDYVNFVENYLDKRYHRACHYSKTVGEFLYEHTQGIYLVTMQGHITVIKDGVLYDTFDCRPRRMWCAWKVK